MSYTIERDGKPYNTRYYLLGRDGESSAPGVLGKCPFNLFVHHFQSDDWTHELHNHPYEWSYSLILKGGYREERLFHGLYSDEIEALDYHPGDVNSLRANTFHRIELLDKKKGCWTLFLTGRKTAKWGFWDRYTGEYRNASDS